MAIQKAPKANKIIWSPQSEEDEIIPQEVISTALTDPGSPFRGMTQAQLTGQLATTEGVAKFYAWYDSWMAKGAGQPAIAPPVSSFQTLPASPTSQPTIPSGGAPTTGSFNAFPPWMIMGMGQGGKKSVGAAVPQPEPPALESFFGRLMAVKDWSGAYPTGSVKLPDGNYVNGLVLEEIRGTNPVLFDGLMKVGMEAFASSETANATLKKWQDARAAITEQFGTLPQDQQDRLFYQMIGLDPNNPFGTSAGGTGISPLAAWQLKSQQWQAGLPYMLNKGSQWPPGWEPGGTMQTTFEGGGTPYNADAYRTVWAPPPGEPGMAGAAPAATGSAPMPAAQPAAPSANIYTPYQPVPGGQEGSLPPGVLPMGTSPTGSPWAFLEYLKKNAARG